MAIDFPNSPSNGDIHTVSGKRWEWDGEKWTAYGASLAPDVLKVDVANNRVGINDTTPSYSLDVTGTARVTGVITASGGVVGNVTGNASGTALTVTQAAQSAITSVGTLSSATITGDLTVDTSTLKVDSSNNRVGIGTASPGEALHVVTASGSSYLKQYNGTATTYLGPDSANTGLFGTSSAHDTRFITNNTERMRILSGGNVGIGTTSPVAKLSVTSGVTNSSAHFGRYDDEGLFLHSDAQSGNYNWRITTNTEVDTGFEIAPSTSVGGQTWADPLFVLKQNGNLGIGTTSPDDLLHMESGTPTFLVSDTGNNYAQDNIQCELLMKGRYHSGTADPTANAYSAAAIKSFKDHSDGNGGAGMSFWTSATGAGGLTQWMTINKSGNVGIGTTAPTNLLSFGVGLNDTKGLSLDYSGEAKAGMLLNPNSGEVRMGAINSTGDYFVTLYADNAEKMRITAAGNVGIGTTSPVRSLTVDGTSYLVARLVGAAASTGAFIEFTGSTGTAIGYLGMPNNDDMHVQATGSSSYLYFKSGGVYNLFINNSGYMLPYTDNTFRFGSSSARWNHGHFYDIYSHDAGVHTSDAALKTDIVDTPLGLDFVKSIRPVQYRWLEGTRSHQGFIAQEVETVLNDTDGVTASEQGMWCVEPVDTTRDVVEDGPDGAVRTTVEGEQFDRQSLRYNELIAPMVKALQELATRVEALESA